MTSIPIKKVNINQPTRIALLCGNSAQQFHLIEQIHQHFSIAGIVLETDENQMKWLWKKKRYKLWLYRHYHTKRRQLMGHSAHRKKYFPVNYKLESLGIPIHYPFNINERATAKFLKKIKPDITIVCGTMYVGKRARTAGNTVINIHGGVLPEYKGNQCIFFALYEGRYDKIGTTIHLVTEQLDGGSIISIVKPEITAEDNDETLYAKSSKLGIDKVVELLKRYDNGETLIAQNQPISSKKVFSHKNRTLWVELKHAIRQISRKKQLKKEALSN